MQNLESQHRAEVRLPNFFLVGAPKAGTTALYHYLAQHPEVYMSPVKEPHFFSDEIRLENFDEDRRRLYGQRNRAAEYRAAPLISSWPAYVELFQGAGARPAVGEASPCYLWSKTAPGNIFARIPQARIIMILRDPADRAFSQFRHMTAVYLRPLSFRALMDASLASESTRIGNLYPFLEFGLYVRQVQRYLDTFPREQVRVHLYDDFQRDPHALLRDLFEFLGVDPAFRADVSQRYREPSIPRWLRAGWLLKRTGLWRQASRLTPRLVRRPLHRAVFRSHDSMRLTPADRSRLIDYYRRDIGELSKLLDRDLSHWLR